MSAYPLVQVKRIATVTLGKMLQSSPDEDSDVLAPYLRAAHVQPSGRIIELEEQPMWFTPRELHALSLCAGDVVVVEGGAGYGRSAVLPEGLPGWGFQNSILRVRSDPQQSTGAFVNYALQSALDSGAIAIACNMSTFAHFTAEKLSAFEIPCPPLEDQHSVVAFLDRETAEIDAFIADQEELIGLLTERRAATISHAVTKGLDPSVPMKDRGTRWPAVVPETWTATTVRHAFRVLDCKHVTVDVIDNGEFPLASIREVKGDVVDLQAAKRTDRKNFDFLTEGGREPLPGDLIVSRNASVGEVAIVPSNLERFAMGQDVALIRDVSGTSRTRFLAYALRSALGKNAFAVASIGSTFKRINVDDIKSVVIWLPPSAVACEAIADYLDRETAELDAAIADAREAIALSKERRAALISAAVTGKIDVRGMM